MRCLEALADHGLGRHVSIRGALALFHYLDYRETHDLDGWWEDSAGPEERAQVLQVVRQVLHAYGPVQERGWGQVVSLELKPAGGKKVFSFQVAQRSAQLEPAGTAPWVDVKLDSLSDLVANKMAALVERGAPRDFRDVHAVCTAGLFEPRQCWDLWARRQTLAEHDSDRARVGLAVETHLARLEAFRPLDSIQHAADRRQAESVRSWVREELLHGL